jgi:hypothetical protein
VHWSLLVVVAVQVEMVVRQPLVQEAVEQVAIELGLVLL